MRISIEYQLNRLDDNEEYIVIEANGTFEGDDLMGFDITPRIDITEQEERWIRNAIYEAKESNWDEDKWKGERI